MISADVSNMIPASGFHQRLRPWIFPDMIRKTTPYKTKKTAAKDNPSQLFFIGSL
jgi:hypothetical protein